MASGTSGAMSTSNTHVKYTISIVENSTNVSNNTSNVTVSVRFYRTNTGYTTYGTGTVYCAINGTTYSAAVTPSQKITNSGIVLFSKTLDIGHDSDGSKTLNAAAYISHEVVTSSSQSYSLALTTIPRASDLSVGNGTLGTAQTISADRKSNSFTHTLTWVCGSYSGTVATQSSSTSWPFTPEYYLASGAPYGDSVYCEFTLTTYNGSTSVGSVTKAVWFSIPDSIKPACTLSGSDAISDAKGYYDTYGGYIQGQSKVHVKVSGMGIYGSSVVSYSTYIEGNIYDGQEFDSAVLKNYGTVQIKSYAKDSRGRWSNASYANITVLQYSNPTVSLSVIRCDSDGTENDRGAYAKLTYSYNITSLSSKNTKSVQVTYKKTSDTSWTTYSGTGLATSYSATNQTLIIPADDAHSYDIKMTVADAFGSTSATASLSTGYCLYHVPLSGKGITFGGVAESDGFNVKMDAHFHKGVTEDIKVLREGDCNELLASGNYYIGTSGTNKPGSGLNGWLTVKSYGDGSYCYQEYVTYQGHRYYRMRDNGTWQGWNYDGGKIVSKLADVAITTSDGEYSLNEDWRNYALLLFAFNNYGNRSETELVDSSWFYETSAGNRVIMPRYGLNIYKSTQNDYTKIHVHADNSSYIGSMWKLKIHGLMRNGY